MQVEKPNRVTRTYTQHLAAEPAAVFPLLCPVREADWITGWDPFVVFSDSGVAEPDCVFVTPAEPENAIWYITRHEPQNAYVEMVKITPRITATKLSIRLRLSDSGTDADITYTHTSLGPDGDVFIESFTEAYYQGFMQAWESRLNYYLQHGTALSAQ